MWPQADSFYTHQINEGSQAFLFLSVSFWTGLLVDSYGWESPVSGSSISGSPQCVLCSKVLIHESMKLFSCVHYASTDAGLSAGDRAERHLEKVWICALPGESDRPQILRYNPFWCRWSHFKSWKNVQKRETISRSLLKSSQDSLSDSLIIWSLTNSRQGFSLFDFFFFLIYGSHRLKCCLRYEGMI